jgi:hypothetical protein
MKASLVWDGGEVVHVPTVLGDPLDDQLTGTPGEQLIEVGTRLCYASLGRDPATGKRKGRSTEATLGNVMKVYHGSVLEHYNRTVTLSLVKWDHSNGHAALVEALLNRPGVYTRFDGERWRITTNVRAVHEWEKMTALLSCAYMDYPFSVARDIGAALQAKFRDAAPLLIQAPLKLGGIEAEFVEPETPHEQWVSMYLIGSRGFSHEMVRHRFAISQRSTRYCEESESKWHWHPLIQSFIADMGSQEGESCLLASALGTRLEDAEYEARTTYNAIVEVLEPWLAAKIPAGTPYRTKTARKQARGAARGFLGNALETQMLFSAPVSGWQHILRMRAADAADAEIRLVAVDALRELKRSRYAAQFADFDLGPAGDGIGHSLFGGGHA